MSRGLGPLRDLARAEPLTSAGLELPSLLLQAPGTPLNVLHGSCRKFHGAGEDALAAGARYLYRTAESVPQRPTALFLTGDQIYADDVPEPVLPVLAQLARRLAGREETVPEVTFVPADRLRQGGHFPNSIFDFPLAGGRQRALQMRQFTSSHAGNHLMRLSEFAAAYLLAWHPRHWRGVTLHGKEAEALARYVAALPAVRRLLANVPTYMIFDDHEVTDDWYRTPDWRRRVVGSRGRGGNATTRRVVANGLAAYWAFQGWGNDPTTAEELAVPVCKRLYPPTAYAPGSGEERDAGDRYEKALLQFRDSGVGWSFTAPTQPMTLFVDCRTRRGDRMIRVGFLTAGALVDQPMWSKLLTLVQRREPADALIIVLGTPFYNLHFMEDLQTLAAQFPGGATEMDLETWSAWEVNQRELLEFCVDTGAATITLLSGDVHYATAASAEIRGSRTFRLNQITCSALKNAAGMGAGVVAWRSHPKFVRNHRPGWWSPIPDLVEVVRFEQSASLGVACVYDTNIGLLHHSRDRVLQELLVPDPPSAAASTAPPADGIPYHRSLRCDWPTQA